jgi:hypothetical protein
MRLYGAIQKVEPQDDGTIRVFGIATTEAVDDQGEIVRASAMRAAIPDYMRFPALREMHQLSAAGTTVEANCGDDGITRIIAHVVDPVAVTKVKTATYRGFSIGGRVTQREAGNPKTITGIVLNEISLVDRPANPDAVLDVWKASSMQTEQAPAAAFNPPIQIWACSDPSHRHIAKSEALTCLKASVTAGADAAQAEIDAALKALEPAEDVTAQTDPPALEPAAEPPPTPEPAAIEPPTPDPPVAGFLLPAADPAAPSGDDTEALAPEEVVLAADTAEFIASVQRSLAEGQALLAQADPAAKAADDNADDDGKKPYGDVEYADPGHQADGKKRYPVDTEAHIRAAWSYIHMPKNASKYEAKDLASVKAKIASAWKAKIDSEGPPSASEKTSDPDFVKALLVKGLWNVCRTAELVQALDWLHEEISMEQIMENDDSPLPARLKGIIAELCAFLNAQVAEETSELLEDADVGDGPGMTDLGVMAMSAVARSLRKTITDTQKVELLVEQLEKAGARHNKSDQAHLDTIAFALHKAMGIGTAKRAEMAIMGQAHKTVLDIGATALNADGRQMLTNSNPGPEGPTTHATVDTGHAGRVTTPNQTGAVPATPHPPSVAKAATADASPAFLMIEAMAKSGNGHGPLAACAHGLLNAVSDGATCKEGAAKPTRHNVEDMARMHTLHAQLCMVDGVTCSGAAADPATKVAAAAPADPIPAASVTGSGGGGGGGYGGGADDGPLNKAMAENTALTKLLGDIVPIMEGMKKQISEIHAQPMPAALVANVGATDATRSNTGTPTTVLTPDDIAKALKGMSEEESTLTLIKARRPIWINSLHLPDAQREARDELAARKA